MAATSAGEGGSTGGDAFTAENTRVDADDGKDPPPGTAPGGSLNVTVSRNPSLVVTVPE